MKKIFFVLFLPVLVVTILSGYVFLDRKSGDAPGVVVVELFTSEGCSSCPAADEALARIAGSYPRNVYVLEFHVDYWNRLGWTDAYSSATYSDRQRDYSALPEGDGVYTPQAIVNGTQHIVGSEESRIRKIIDASLLKTIADHVQLIVKTNNGSVEVSYSLEDNARDLLNIALIQLHAQTKVGRGENGGRVLQHINIVRGFQQVSAREGKINFKLPAELTAKDCAVIAFSQNKSNRHVTGAASSLL